MAQPRIDVNPMLEALSVGKSIKEVASDFGHTYHGMRRTLLRRAREIGAKHIWHLVVMYKMGQMVPHKNGEA